MGRRWAIAAAVLPAVAYALPPALRAGVPAFQQDWVWPAFPGQCTPFMLHAMSPWDAGGLGEPASYPQPWLPYLVSGALCNAVGPHWSLVLMLACAAALGGALAFAFLKNVLSLGTVASLAGVALFWGNPVTLNELQAGHFLFSLSYAMLPGVALCFSTRPSLPRIVIGGALLGIAAAQQQFVVFAPVVALAASLANGSITWLWLPSLGVMFIVIAPQWLSYALYGASPDVASVAPIAHWEYAQSLPLHDALRLVGYIGGYDNLLLGKALETALWLPPLLACIGAALAWRRMWPYALLWLAGFVLVWGLYGAASLPLRFAFAHVRAFALFRELYDFAALCGFTGAVLGAMAIAAIARRSVLLHSIAAACVLIVGACVLSRSATDIPTYVPTAKDLAVARTLAQLREPGRFITVPAALPVGPVGTREAGFSPWILPIGAQSNAAQALAYYPSGYASATVDAQHLPTRERLRVLRLFGISHIVEAAALQTHSVIEPGLRQLIPLPAAASAQTRMESITGTQFLSVTPYSVSPGTLTSDIPQARMIDPVIGGKPLRIVTGAGYDPRTQWAATVYWPQLPRWIYAQQSGIFTFRSVAELTVPPRSFIIAGSQDGRLRALGCTPLEPLDGHFVLLSCGGTVRFSAVAPIAVARVVVGGIRSRARRALGAQGTANIVRETNTMLAADISASQGSAVLFRLAYNDAWECTGCGGPHVRLDGFANGWIARGAISGRVTIRLRKAGWFYASLFASMVTLVFAFAMLLLERRLRSLQPSR